MPIIWKAGDDPQHLVELSTTELVGIFPIHSQESLNALQQVFSPSYILTQHLIGKVVCVEQCPGASARVFWDHMMTLENIP